MATTEDNLKTAFAGESQANRKYLAYAKQAEKDGFPNIAKLFRTAAEAETIHALGHFMAMGGVGSTLDNLQAAINGETYEYTDMYPPMLKQAEEDGHKAERMFRFANAVEETHAALYEAALEAARQGKDLETSEIYICPICGHIEFGTPPESCPVCRAKAKVFTQVQ
jgi:rubrerythrin